LNDVVESHEGRTRKDSRATSEDNSDGYEDDDEEDDEEEEDDGIANDDDDIFLSESENDPFVGPGPLVSYRLQGRHGTQDGEKSFCDMFVYRSALVSGAFQKFLPKSNRFSFRVCNSLITEC